MVDGDRQVGHEGISHFNLLMDQQKKVLLFVLVTTAMPTLRVPSDWPA